MGIVNVVGVDEIVWGVYWIALGQVVDDGRGALELVEAAV